MARLGRSYPSPVLQRRRIGAFINANEANATTVTTATHAVGDFLIIVGWRTLTAIPGDPGAPWVTDFTTTGGGVGVRVAHTTATGTSDASGTWTGASPMQNQNYRAATGLGAIDFTSGNSATLTYPALTLQRPGLSWCLRVAWQNGNTDFATATLPAGYTRRNATAASTGMVIAMDSNGPVNAVAADNQTSTVSNTWRTLSIEILI